MKAMGVEIAVPLGLFVAIVLVCFLVLFFRFRGRQELQMTLRAAIDSGQTLSPEMLEKLSQAMQEPDKDLRRGAVAMAIGLALVVFAIAVGEDDATGPLLGMSAFPFLIGAAYLLLWFFNRDKADQG
ncbi:MAG: DUF6249 domain-containing protein [Pseudomonadota bacterium]